MSMVSMTALMNLISGSGRDGLDDRDVPDIIKDFDFRNVFWL
jgi:hypothetical protein